MLTRIGAPIASGIAAIALTIALSGAAVGVALVADTTPPEGENAPALVDTTATFEDVDGDGTDDDCRAEPAVAVPEAEAAAAAAVDLDHDGTISASEAAQSGRIGGKNCNHGGYVSGVAKADDEDAEDEEAETDEDAEVECEAAPEEETETPEDETTPEDEGETAAPNAHGKAVSEVARSDAVGGKNCNHGGAVSEAAHAAKVEKAAERAAAKAEKAAERAAAKAERAAARAAAKAAREAAEGN